MVCETQLTSDVFTLVFQTVERCQSLHKLYSIEMDPTMAHIFTCFYLWSLKKHMSIEVEIRKLASLLLGYLGDILSSQCRLMLIL